MDQRQAGTLLADRFRLVERVGRGGFGETWRAHDEMLGIDVALKLYYDNDPDRTSRYLREARSLARFSSLPGIAGVRDFLNIDGMACLVMEYVDGEDLSSLLNRVGRLTLDQVRRILLPVAEVLACLHREGVLHRDVSPDNVRVSKNGMGVLLDFGSALSMEQMSAGTITVKPGYAPPEQYGDPSTQGPWTDVYSLAATAYQCLCGVAPSDSLRRTFADDIVVPSQLGVELPAGVEDALMAALALDYTKRTQNVGEFVMGLRGQAARPAPARPEPVKQPEPVAQQPDQSAQFHPQPVAPKPEQNAQPQQSAETQKEASVPETSQPQQTEDRPARKSRREKKQTEPKPRRGGAPASGKRFLPVIAGVAVVALLGIFLLFMRSGGAGSSSANPSSLTTYVSQENVTADTLSSLLNPGYGAVSFTQCVLTDDAIEALAQEDQLESITFNYCQGFTSLGSLGKATNLKKLTIFGLDEADLKALFPNDMSNIESLKLENVRVASGLDALKNFTGLALLELSPTEGVDKVDFLSSMPDLETLLASGVDFSGDKAAQLAQLPKLETVELNYSNLETIDWASSCPELYELEACGNSISDLSSLAGLEKLNYLYLDSNQISDIGPLSELASLSTLVLSNNEISDVTPLRDNARIYTLSLENNKLTSVDGLQGMKSLARLSLANNEIADISPITENTKVQQLDISNNDLTDLSACERMIALESLYAQHNQLEDISHISTCSQLKTLLLQDNKITDISALDNAFTELKTLNIAFNQIGSLKPLEGCSQLRFLIANNNNIGTLDGLAGKHELEDLMLDSNQITDISAISSSMDNLENLDLGHNQIKDISALSNLSPTSAHYGMTNRASVCLDHNQVDSIEAIPTNVEFRLLSLYANPLKDYGSLNAETAKWYDIYLPYYDDANFAGLGELPIAGVSNFVDVPYDKQVQVLRDMGLTTDDWNQPHFITTDKADEDMQAFRDKVNTEVSGTTFAATGEVASEDSVKVQDDEA